jgi:sugar phosphate isomerase/epimerase
MRLGISSYCYVWSLGVAGYPQPDRPMTALDLLDEASFLGVGLVQIGDNLPLHRLAADELSQVAAHAQAGGIDLETGIRGIQPEQLRTYLDISKRLNSPVLRAVIDPEGTGDGPPNRVPLAGPDDVVGALRDIAPEFEQADVRLAIENHDRFPATALREIMERVGSSHVGICFDTANSIGCVESAHFVLETLAPWIVNVHLKDYCILRPRHYKGFLVEGRPAGSGQLDIPRILQQLQDVGYSQSVILELWPPPQESLDASMHLEREWVRESIRYLRGGVPKWQRGRGAEG